MTFTEAEKKDKLINKIEWLTVDTNYSFNIKIYKDEDWARGFQSKSRSQPNNSVFPALPTNLTNLVTTLIFHSKR